MPAVTTITQWAGSFACSLLCIHLRNKCAVGHRMAPAWSLGETSPGCSAGGLQCWCSTEAFGPLDASAFLGLSSHPRQRRVQQKYGEILMYQWLLPKGADAFCSTEIFKCVCILAVKLPEFLIQTIIQKTVTYSVKSTGEMHYLIHCLTMAFSLKLNTALAVIIYALYRWGSPKWILKPCWGQCYYTDSLLLSRSFCFWQCELTTEWKCIPPT